MRNKTLLASLLVAVATPAFAQLDWISSTFEDGNAEHSRSLPINTDPQKYHVVWETLVIPTSNQTFNMMNGQVVADNKVIISIATVNDKDKTQATTITAMDADTGHKVWHVAQTGLYDQEMSYHSGKLFTFLNNDDTAQSLVSYDINTGKLINSVVVPNDVENLQPYGDSLYFTLGRHGLGSLNPDTSKINWTKPLDAGKYFGSTLSINNQYIITREFDNIRLYDRANGTEIKKIWRPDSGGMGGLQAAPIVDNDTAYAIFQSPGNRWEGRLFAFDLKKKTVKWSVPNQYNEYANVIMRSMILTNHTLISQAYTQTYQDQRINFIDAETGKTLWAWFVPRDEQMNGPYDMVATNDVLFIAGANHVLGVSLTTHQVVWQSEKPGYRLFLGAGKLFMYGRNETKAAYLTAIALN